MNFIENSFGNRRGNSTLTEFLKEVQEFKTPLEQTYINVLGKERASKILELDKYLLSPNSYLFKTSSLRGLTACGISGKENSLFYVMISPEGGDEFKIDSTGEMEVDSKALRTFPFFFFSPKIIKKNARELKKTSLPPYLILWIHEYSHFIGYCLQKRPVAVAALILYGYLANEYDSGLTVKDLAKLIKSKNEKLVEIAKTLVYLQSLDEDMANFLEELIVKDLGLDEGPYFSELMRDTLFYPYFKRWGKERFVEYIEDWNNANFKVPEFMKTFLKSINKIDVERYPSESLI